MENKETNEVPENVTVDTVSVADANVNENTTTNANDVDPRIAELAKQIQELNDKYLRTAAELENTRRRAAIDAESRATRRAMGVAEKILPVMDAIDAAKKHAPDDAGILAMARAMDGAFAQIGITKIESVGEVLNPMFHNAIQVIDAPADAQPKPKSNTIISELQPGYMFGDTVLRTAMVVVCK